MKNYNLVSLSFKTTTNYEQNLSVLSELITKCEENSIIVAPEVCLTGYDYDNFDEVLNFSNKATSKITSISHNKIIVFTLIEKDGDKIFNNIKIFHNGKVVYKRAKARLFKFGDEHKYMQEGEDKDIKIIEVDGIKIATFICFELRFKKLWQKAEGADVIVAPSYWGELRTEHFKSITQTLAIINQCYLIASDSQNDECTKMSGIISPYGVVKRNNQSNILTLPYSKKEIKTMRRYMDVGIK